MQVDPNYLSRLTQSIDAASAAEQRLTTELASGLRVQTVADDPVAVSANVRLAASIAAADAFTRSAASVEGRLQLTSSVLGEVVTQTTSAISLAVKAGDGTLSASSLDTIRQQVTALRDGILQLANTSYQGQFVFAGSKGNQAPYTLDATTDPAAVSYAGDAHVQHVVTPDGQSLQASVAGSAVFSSAGSNLLGSLNKLVSDLTAGNQAAVGADGSALSAALGTVSAGRAVVGYTLSRLTDASSYASTQQTVFTAQQSSLLSADTAQVASSLSSVETQHQALLKTYAALSQTNLFSTLFR